MKALAESVAHEPDASRLADLSSCPKCGELLIGPQSSSYLGLGRIEHAWLCDGCGEKFQTTTRLAGVTEHTSA
jgi:hypothetical protein